MSWLITIAVGFVAGALGKFLMPGKDPGGCIITTILGIAGALLGKYVAGLMGISAPAAGSSLDLPSLAVSVGGVILLLLIYRIFLGKKGK